MVESHWLSARHADQIGRALRTWRLTAFDATTA